MASNFASSGDGKSYELRRQCLHSRRCESQAGMRRKKGHLLMQLRRTVGCLKMIDEVEAGEAVGDEGGLI